MVYSFSVNSVAEMLSANNRPPEVKMRVKFLKIICSFSINGKASFSSFSAASLRAEAGHDVFVEACDRAQNF